MAAAEARAVWQRTANRYFVQEDAKRAPKLACCQSSAASTKQIDSGPAGSTDVPDSSAVGFMPLNKNPSYSNLPSDTRWWLQMQPSYGYQKDLMYEQLGSLEDEIEIIKSSLSDSLSKETSGLHMLNERDDIHNKKFELHVSMHSINSAVCAKPDHKIEEKEEDPLSCKNMQEFLDLVDPGENYEFVEVDPSDCKRTKVHNESCFDPVSPWLASEKTVPWWRTTDKDELASLVAQKSLDYIENCDLPPPQKTNVRKFPYGNFQCFNRNDLSLEQKPGTGYTSAPISHSQLSLDSLKTLKMAPVEDGRAEHGFDESSSHCTNQSNAPQTDASESDFTKAKLLEALCHSQTRAREAEKAVKQAYAEKEHVVKLFFKQASQLFAYKQWFQLLQLEALYHQIKNKEPPISTLIPSVLPWTAPSKGKKLRKNLHKSTKGKRNKRGQPRLDVTKYAIAFALGLGLVGAGLLLGWTVGWMLPF